MLRFVFALLMIGSLFPACACSTPVFRYALERWDSDPYLLLILHRGPLNEAKQEAIKKFTAGDSSAMFANWMLMQQDLEQPVTDLFLKDLEGALEKPLAKLADVAAGGAHAVLMYPRSPMLPLIAWQGTLDEALEAGLHESPLRRESARRLLTGDSFVMLLLESGNAERDDAAAKIIERQFKHLEETTDLSVPDEEHFPGEEPIEAAEKPEPLKLKLSLLRVRADDANEAVLRALLLQPFPAAAKQGQPLAFPLFGRGRVLDPLVGEEIQPELLNSVAAFLTGACSCEIKEQNPGFDLLMAVEWERLVTDRHAVDHALPPLVGLTAAPAVAETPAAPEASAAEPDEPGSSRLWVGVGGGLAVLVLAVLLLSVLSRAKRA